MGVTTSATASLAHFSIPKVAAMVLNASSATYVDQMRRDGVKSKRNNSNAYSGTLVRPLMRLNPSFKLEFVYLRKASNRCPENSMLFLYSCLHDPLPEFAARARGARVALESRGEIVAVMLIPLIPMLP